MYKVILVDDEILTREAISENTPWEEAGFALAGTAENGKEAINLIETVRPELVITDITMPVMNGLELSKYIKENHPEIAVIIISGYNEFEYAKKALSYGVMEYLVKPFTPDELLEILSKARDELSKRIDEEEEIESLKAEQKSNKSKLQKLFVKDLLEGKATSRNLVSQMENFGMSAVHKYQAVVFVVITNAGSFYTNQKQDADDDDSLLHFAIANIIGELIEGMDGILQFIGTDERSVYVFSADAKSALEERIDHIGQQLISSVNKYLGVKISLIVGDFVENILDWSVSYTSARNALKNAFSNTKDSIIYACECGMPGRSGSMSGRNEGMSGRSGSMSGRNEGMPGRSGSMSGRNGDMPGRDGAALGRNGSIPGRSGATLGKAGDIPGRNGATLGKAGDIPGRNGATPGKAGDIPGRNGATSRKAGDMSRRDGGIAEGQGDKNLTTYADEIIDSLKKGEGDKLYEQSARLFSELRDSHFDRNDILFRIQNIAVAILMQLKSILDPASQLRAQNHEFFQNMQHTRHISELEQHFNEFLGFIHSQLMVSYLSVNQKLAYQAQDYIKQNYSRDDLSLNDVCTFLGMSPSYFSVVYKNETGETFGETMTRVRMERAKELLLDPAKKNYEIAEQVGFADPHYFGSVFKKYTGMTPTEYSKKLRGGRP